MADEAPTAEAQPLAASADELQPAVSAPSFQALEEEPSAPAPDWQPPQVDDRGFAIDGDGLPLNLRLRAAVLADRGDKSDPAGTVSPEAIVAAGERLYAYDQSFPPLSGLRLSDLEARAEREGVDISGASTNQERAALIQAARPPRIV